MLENSQYENWMTFDAGCRPGEALKEASRYVGRNGEVGQRNTIVWCGESNRFAQCDLCFMFRGKMDLAVGEKKLMYRRLLNKHHDDVRRDKARYYWNR